MRAGRIVAGVFGGFLALLAFGMLVGGGVLVWAHGTQRDAEGFLTSPAYALETNGYAITSEEVDIAAHPADWWPSGLADVRFQATSDMPLFIGIGPAEDVSAYLQDVAGAEVTHLGPGSSEVRLRDLAGDSPPPGAPGDQSFWVASRLGGSADLVWDVAGGEWTVVLMNADGSAPVAAELVAGVRIGILLGIGVGLLVFGVMGAAAAAALLVWATRRRTAVTGEAAPPDAAGEAFGPYPVALEGRVDEGLSRWMWLVKWFLAIPHYIVLAFLWAAFALLTLVAFFAILFTGRYPRGIFDFNVGVLRWSWRVGFYAFSTAATDRYPPFSLAESDYPTRFDVAYPERLSRGLVLVKWWLLAIPHYLIVGLFTSGLVWWITEVGDGEWVLRTGGGLIGILVLIAVITLAFTGRYPPSLFDLIMGLNRWVYRVFAYAALMRDEYPPFRLDLGGGEPPVEVASPERDEAR